MIFFSDLILDLSHGFKIFCNLEITSGLFHYFINFDAVSDFGQNKSLAFVYFKHAFFCYDQIDYSVTG